MWQSKIPRDFNYWEKIRASGVWRRWLYDWLACTPYIHSAFWWVRVFFNLTGVCEIAISSTWCFGPNAIPHHSGNSLGTLILSRRLESHDDSLTVPVYHCAKQAYVSFSAIQANKNVMIITAQNGQEPAPIELNPSSPLITNSSIGGSCWVRCDGNA